MGWQPGRESRTLRFLLQGDRPCPAPSALPKCSATQLLVQGVGELWGADEITAAPDF